MKICNYAFCAAFLIVISGCGSQKNDDRGFTTSGSREADQRAEQRIAKDKQTSEKPGDNGKTPEKKTLFERLGGAEGITAIVNDFVDRALADPRVNWERKGVKQGGFSIKRGKSIEWNADKAKVDEMKKHIVQFVSLSTGGPTHYDGRDMKEAHANMRITNAEFDASVGDLKVTLDKLGVPTGEQKELIAIVESTRPQIVGER